MLSIIVQLFQGHILLQRRGHATSTTIVFIRTLSIRSIDMRACVLGLCCSVYLAMLKNFDVRTVTM